MAHAVAAPRADRRKSTLLNIHKSPVDVVVVVAGAALLEPSIRDVATDVVPMIQVIPCRLLATCSKTADAPSYYSGDPHIKEAECNM
jgi:hypothetical protein